MQYQCLHLFIWDMQIGPGEKLLAPRSGGGGCALVLWCFALLFDRSLQTSANIAMLLISFGITVTVTVKNLRIEHLPMLLELGHPSRTFGTDFSQSLRNVNLPRSLALGWDNNFKSCEVFTNPIYVVVESFRKDRACKYREFQAHLIRWMFSRLDRFGYVTLWLIPNTSPRFHANHDSQCQITQVLCRAWSLDHDSIRVSREIHSSETWKTEISFF